MDKKNIESIFSLTTTQKGLLFHFLKEKEEGAYIGQHILHLKNDINAALFEESLRLLAQRYEIFRTRIVYTKLDNPMQVVLKNNPIEFQYLEGDADDFLKKDRERGFCFEKENLIRIALIRTGENTYQNIWTFHHILIDGYCIGILARDFFQIYDNLQKGLPIELPLVPSYKKYVNWLKGQNLEQSKTYWEEYTKGVEKKVSVPGDFKGEKGDIGIMSYVFSDKVSQEIIAYASSHQITINAMLQSIWGLLLSAYTDVWDFVFGSVMAARPIELPEADKMVGLFSGTYPVRFCGGKDKQFVEIAKQLNKDFIMAIKNASCSLGELPTVSKLIHNIYIFENFDLKALYEGAKAAGLQIVDIEMKNHSNYEFSISISQKEEKFILEFRYDSRKYSNQAVCAIGEDMEKIAKGICENQITTCNMAKEYISYQFREEEIIIQTDKKEKEYIAPETEIQKQLAEIFEEVLGVENPGIYDDFFELGGDSILGMRFVAKCEKRGLQLSLKELFCCSDIAQMAAIVEKSISADKKIQEKVENEKYLPDAEHQYEPFPLNGIQGAYLMGNNEEFELGGFTTQYYTEAEGEYDIPRLETALQKVVEHQAALRTIVEDITSQRVLKETDAYHIVFEDLRKYSHDEQQKNLLQCRKEMTSSVFSEKGFPYFQVKAFRIDDYTYRLCFLIECICVDGAGLVMFLKELSHYYENPTTPLPKIKFTFRDYQMALLEETKKERYQRDKKYWLEKVSWIPLGPEIPLKGNPKELKNPRFLRKQCFFSTEQYKELKEFCKKNKITMAALLCTAYMEVLSFWSNQKRFSINMTVFERNEYHEDVERLIGDFTKLIVIDTDMGKEDFLSQAFATTETIAEALEHNSYNGIHFIRELAFVRQLGTKVVMPYVFTCALMDSSNTLIKPTYAISRTPQVYIDCQVTEREGGLFVNWDYPKGLFDDEMITEMFDQYTTLIQKALDCPKVCISEQTRQKIVQYNDTFDTDLRRKEIAKMTLPDLFMPSFIKYADNVAVQDMEKKWSYRTLADYTYKTANALKRANVAPGDCVCVMGERKAETVAAILAILLCGGTYVPLNVQYPKDRIDYIMKKTKAILTVDSNYVRTAAQVEQEECFSHQANPKKLAYIIFTSGTTGRPKGVAIRHNSVVNTILDINKRCAITQEDCFLGLAEFGFDLSVYDVFGSLSTGAKLCIVNNQKNPEEILNWLEQEHITFWNSVPAVMQMLTGVVEKKYRNEHLKNVYLSGDWIPLTLPDKIRTHFVNAKVTSLGGATEASIWSIYYPTEQKVHLASIPYGMPLRNQSVYIMNEDLELCPIGVRGEICIGGDGVASGYYGEKEKTEMAFVEHKEFGRIYKTGDYGKLHKGGYIEFLGRIDGQVKIRGFRVELGEIESCALEYGKLRQAVAVNKNIAQGEILALYVEGEKEIDIDALRQFLQSKLPDYMIPAVIVQMEQLPVTQNGKVDRNQLKTANVNLKRDVRYCSNTEMEQKIGQIFKTLLEVEQIDYEQSFFEMGLDSLKAVMITNEFKKIGIQISLTELYEYNTITLLAKRLESIVEKAEDTVNDFEDGEI